jgi:hypothetical protein
MPPSKSFSHAPRVRDAENLWISGREKALDFPRKILIAITRSLSVSVPNCDRKTLASFCRTRIQFCAVETCDRIIRAVLNGADLTAILPRARVPSTGFGS